MNGQQLKEEYINYVRENTHFNLLAGESYEVVTPYTNTYGDGISFTIKYEGSHYIVTDDGFTIWKLQLNGINLTNKTKRQQLLNSILNYNGFELSGNEILKKAKRTTLGQTIHDMTQVLLNIYDLSALHPQNIQSHFLEDVKMYFNKSTEYNVFPDLSITGRSKLEHKFNYLMMSKGKYKLVQVHNKINKEKMDFILASWLDTTENRAKTYSRQEDLYIIISPEGYKDLKEEYKSAFKQYDINIINFENKKKLVSKLGA